MAIGGRILGSGFERPVCSKREPQDPSGKIYCTTPVAAGIGFAIEATVEKKSVPRVSVAKYRVPVPPGVTGSAFAKYELVGIPADALHEVLAAAGTVPGAASADNLTK